MYFGNCSTLLAKIKLIIVGGLASAISGFWLCFAVDDISLFKDFVDHISLLRKLINEMFPSEKMCK